MRSSNSEIMCRELSDLPIKLQSEIVFSDIHMVPRDGGIWLIEIKTEKIFELLFCRGVQYYNPIKLQKVCDKTKNSDIVFYYPTINYKPCALNSSIELMDGRHHLLVLLKCFPDVKMLPFALLKDGNKLEFVLGKIREEYGEARVITSC